MVSKLETQLPSPSPPLSPPDFALSVDLLCEDLQKDGEQRNGAEDGRLVSGCEVSRLIIQKRRVVTEAAADGNKDGNEESKRSTGTFVHLRSSKMATTRRETQELESDSRTDEQCVCLSMSAFPWGRKTRCSGQRKHQRKTKIDGQIWRILSFVGVNALLALSVDVEERREEMWTMGVRTL